MTNLKIDISISTLTIRPHETEEFHYILTTCLSLVSRREILPFTILDIPKGFVTDFASVPRIMWPIISPWGKHKVAAVVHDYLYRQHTLDLDLNEISRKQCDRVFRLLMKRSGVAWWKRTLMYTAVRLFGGKSWKKIANDGLCEHSKEDG